MLPLQPQGKRKPRAPSPSVVINKSTFSAQPEAVEGPLPRHQSPSVVQKTSVAQLQTDEGHFPRHYDRAWRHQVPATSEAEAIKSLKATWDAIPHDTHAWNGYSNKTPLCVELNDYEIYSLPEDNFVGELHSLDYMDEAGKKLVCNGVLSVGAVRHFVQGIPVKSYSIEGYGDDTEPNTTVYIVSLEASRDREYDIWYKLETPSMQYKRFQEAFQWIATLGKHVMDFLEDQRDIRLVDFRQKFSDWIQQRFGDNAAVSSWRKAYGRTDFRRAVHAYVGYLWSEAKGLQNDAVLLNHPLWDECARDDNAMIEPKCARTVATPHVYECFKNRYFAGQLVEMQPSNAVRAARDRRIDAFGLPSQSHTAPRPKTSQTSQIPNTTFNVGDVVAITPDEYENKTWRKTAKDASVVCEWLGYVQRVQPTHSGRYQRLFVIWLYRPEDTTISTTDYPTKKELFISDNCNCEEHELLSTDVVRICSVEWFSKGYHTNEDFLVRLKYETKTNSFVTMSETDFCCSCENSRPEKPPVNSYRRGETVYLKENSVLHPAVIEESDVKGHKVKVRQLLRLNRLKPGALRGLPQRPIAANELAWTNEFCVVSPKIIMRRCYLRFFAKKDVVESTVAFPYNRGGAGDYWILSMRLDTSKQSASLEYLSASPRFLEGPDYTSSAPAKLPGLSLFSGLGSLDKGLEAGGAVHFHTAVEMSGRAIQTLRANADDPEQLRLWFGSVDDYLHALSSGDSPNMRLVAKIGDVAVIAAGSPCPGFSKLQQDWKSEQSLRNAAHVTTFASFVDIYRPEYGFLENVVNMGSTRKGFEEELVLSQLVGCLVSMGYQVQQFIMSSWNYGSPQHRNRLIISIAAPGRTPIVPPQPTHGDPEGIRSKSVGKLLNGERFGVQDAQLTPFPHITPGEALGHLPNIGCGIKHPCIQYPDHVLRLKPSIKERRSIACIPTNPPGVGLEYAIRHGLIPKYLYETKSEVTGKSYKRIKKDGLIGTIVTAPSPHDSRSGPFVHWEQNRCITLEEARIGQGIPDHEVLIGNISDQYKMVGNAVDRRVSEQLGLALRRAWDQNRRNSVVKRAVAVVIDTKRQINSSAPVPTMERLTPFHLDEDAGTTNASTVTKAIDHVDTMTSSSSATDITLGRSTESKTPVNASSRSSRSTIAGERDDDEEEKGEEEEEDEEDGGPIPRGRRKPPPAGTLKNLIIPGETARRAELKAQLQAGRSPSRTATSDDNMIEVDAETIMPGVAISHNGFLGRLPKTISEIPPSQAFIEASKTTTPPNTSELLERTKRRYQDEADSQERSRNRSRGVSGTYKRFRWMQTEFPTMPADRQHEAQEETQKESVRKTRHSGSGVEYVPKNWSQRVEKNVSSNDKPEKARPIRYA